MKVYRLVTRDSMESDEEEKMVSIKWAITNKGTEEHPIVKARPVAREFNIGDKRGELFAGTPGLMAMRTVISRAMTRCENGARRSIMLADVKTAFLYGNARRSFFVELPPEDPMSASGRYVGKLERAMYGTRDDPKIWQDHRRKTHHLKRSSRSLLLIQVCFSMRHETFSSVCMWTICYAQDSAKI